MSNRLRSYIETQLNKLATVRWRRRARRASYLDNATLRRLRGQARDMRWELDRVLFEAEARLALPLIGSNAMQLPPSTVYSHRPELWQGPISPRGVASVATKTPIGSGAELFHDCKISELTYCQIRNSNPEDLAPFGLRLDVFRFDGSFLSLSVKLPKDACKGVTSRDIIRLDCVFDFEKPIEIFARLNIKHGPNLEQVVREISDRDAGHAEVDFDLSSATLNEKRLEEIWVDLIFEGPEMNQIVIRDFVLSRRPRADL